jgi:hypothetical protein
VILHASTLIVVEYVEITFRVPVEDSVGVKKHAGRRQKVLELP